jgi:uncharacterized protein
MTGNLTKNEIEDLLNREMVGRIGCYGNEDVYVVPISYVYYDHKIYCHTHEGQKVQTMRWNPHVCFEVDDTRNMGNWQSAIAWGTFKELNGEERTAALKLLTSRELPYISSLTTHLGRNWPFIDDDVSTIDGIVFSITLTRYSGRFEHVTEFPDVHG